MPSLLPQPSNRFSLLPNSSIALVTARCRTCGVVVTGSASGGLQIAEVEHVLNYCTGGHRPAASPSTHDINPELMRTSYHLEEAAAALCAGEGEKACAHLHEAATVLECLLAATLPAHVSTTQPAQSAQAMAA